MLWHQATGPLCVSSMSRYDLLEPGNMAREQTSGEVSTLSPRLEHGAFSSELDWQATLEVLPDGVRAHGRLCDIDGNASGAFTLETRFQNNEVLFDATGEGATFVLPILSHSEEPVAFEPHRIEISKARACVVIESKAVIGSDARRIFHFVPGAQAVRLEIFVPAEGVRVSLRVQALSE
jgi:hypothetical protein